MNDDYDYDDYDDDEEILYCAVCDDNCLHVNTINYSKCLCCGLKDYDDYDDDEELE